MHNYALVITRATGEFYTCKYVQLIRQDCFGFVSSLQSDPEVIKDSWIMSQVEGGTRGKQFSLSLSCSSGYRDLFL